MYILYKDIVEKSGIILIIRRGESIYGYKQEKINETSWC